MSTSPKEFKISTLTLDKFDSKSILIKSLLGFGYKLIGALINSFKPIPSSKSMSSQTPSSSKSLSIIIPVPSVSPEQLAHSSISVE